MQRRLAAILTADAAGYSRLMAEDEEGTARTLVACRHLISDLVDQRSGRVVDAPGDNVLAEFPSVVDALRCAVEIQEELARRNAQLSGDCRLLFRIGVNLGDILVEGERIMGDGVNVAARLESLAEPGGICVSGTVFDQVEGKLPLEFDDAGEQAVKNLPKPVRVYRARLADRLAGEGRAAIPRRSRLRTAAIVAGGFVLLVGAGIALTWPLAMGLALDLIGLSGPPVDPALPAKPSLVVLPFVNIGGDPEQEYLIDGVTEDLTTALAGSPDLFVISRSSALTYKGKLVKIRDVGRELGVRYVLEGSVRSAGGRLRVTAQLIDATTGLHVWGKSYERDRSDRLELQSELAEAILGELLVEVRAAEIERIRRIPTRHLGAWDTLSRGIQELQTSNRESLLGARSLFERAIELDPGLALAHAVLAISYNVERLAGWGGDAATLDRAEALARKAVELDASEPSAHVALAQVHILRRRPAAALAEAERAIELAPSMEWAHMIRAAALLQQGRIIPAVESINRALRLNPRAPWGILIPVAYIRFRAGRVDEAVENWERIRDSATGDAPVVVLTPLAAIYEKRGRREEARAAVREMLRIRPDLTADQAPLQIPGSLSDEQIAEWATLLRQAGLP